MTTRKSFRASSDAHESDQPVFFDIEGSIEDENGAMVPWKETFRARPRISTGMMLKFADLSQMTDREDDPDMTDDERTANMLTMLAAIRDLMSKMVVTAHRERFIALMDDDDKEVELNTLLEIMNFVFEQASARPTGGQSPSTSSENSTGPDSAAGASPAKLIYSRPER